MFGLERRMFLRNKRLNHSEFIEGKLALKSVPTWLQIEPGTLCNLHCVMCRSEKENIEWGRRAVPGLFDKIVKSGWLGYLELIELNGWGETLLNADIGPFIEKCARFKDLKVQITTNGLLLDDDKIAALLCKSPNVNLIFSIDSSDPDIYERIRRGGSWKRLVSSLRALNDKRIGLKSALSKECHCLVNKLNIDRLNGMVDFAVEHEFGSLAFQRVHNCPELEVSDDLATPAMEMAVAYAKYKGIVCTMYGYRKTKEEVSKSALPGSAWRCPRPWKHMMIRSDGDVVPCCYLANYKCDSGMGNIMNEPIGKIWNSKRYIELRKSALTGYPSFCYSETGGCEAKTKFTPNIRSILH
jgi:radical SAM protein with 4Fe4S-binding SPASM domain